MEIRSRNDGSRYPVDNEKHPRRIERPAETSMHTGTDVLRVVLDEGGTKQTEFGPVEEGPTYLQANITLASVPTDKNSLGNLEEPLAIGNNMYRVGYEYRRGTGPAGQKVPSDMREYVPLLKERIIEEGYPEEKLYFADEHERGVFEGELPHSMLATSDDVALLDRIRYAEATGGDKEKVFKDWEALQHQRAKDEQKQWKKFQDELK